MAEVALTTKQVAAVFGISERTAREWADDKRKFPRAAGLLYESRRLGHRVPAQDVLDYAQATNPAAYERARKLIESLNSDPVAV